MAERKESADDIEITVGDGSIVTVETLSLNEEWDVETIYGSGYQYPSGYSIKNAKYNGSLTVKGEATKHRGDFFTGEAPAYDGPPKVMDAILVHHMKDEESGVRKSTSFQDVIVTTSGYEMNDGEITETSYEFIAMRRKTVTDGGA